MAQGRTSSSVRGRSRLPAADAGSIGALASVEGAEAGGTALDDDGLKLEEIGGGAEGLRVERERVAGLDGDAGDLERLVALAGGGDSIGAGG